MAPGAITEDITHDAAISIKSKNIAAMEAGVASNQPTLQAPRFHQWDAGLFESELISNDITPRKITVDVDDLPGNLIIPDEKQPDPIARGSFTGTQKALTEMYKRSEDSFASYFDAANFETSIPRPKPLVVKKDIYTYQTPWADNFPPHLNLIPPKDAVPLTAIFNKMRLFDTSSLLTQLVPDFVYDFIHSNPEADTLDGISKRNKELRAQKKDIFAEPNIGDRDDWYTDRVFAQQQFTGTNPMTIEKISDKLFREFTQEAQKQGNNEVSQLLKNTDRSDLFVQDYSYFREAVKVAPDTPLHSKEDTNWLRRVAGYFSSGIKNDDAQRYLQASVCLFVLDPSGQLHPLAIVVDYLGSMDKSVVVFNRRVLASAHVPSYDESVNWAWRYAKICVQACDWTRHEVTVHLTNTHFVEEATIVAAQRSFEDSHPVHTLLRPHWLKTLSLNAGARSVLVPSVISKIAGLETGQVKEFIQHAYKKFDWVQNFVPNDLNRRGFPLDEIKQAGPQHPRFRKYTYGRNMLEMWTRQRQSDQPIQNWAKEMRADYGGNLKSFPTSFDTFDDLADSVTMCIHLASPQHTAVNYLQEYYQSFVINRPPCLCRPPPKSLKELLRYQEPDLMRALPVNAPRTWLLASHLPHLLSYKVAQDQNLVTYAKSLQVLTRQKVEAYNSADERDVKILAAANKLLMDLVKLSAVFAERSEELVQEGDVRYDVMDPVMTAVSILI